MLSLRDRLDTLMARYGDAGETALSGEECASRTARLPARNRIAGEDAAENRSGRRRRWVALCIRRAYGLAGWVPEDVAAHIVHIAWDAHAEALVLKLDTGARLVDRYDSIELVGAVDEIAIGELVACVRRRGWQRVRVEGNSEFRAAAARALVAAGIEVLDSPVRLAELDHATERPGSLPAPRSEQPPAPAGPFGRA